MQECSFIRDWKASVGVCDVAACSVWLKEKDGKRGMLGRKIDRSLEFSCANCSTSESRRGGGTCG